MRVFLAAVASATLLSGPAMADGFKRITTEAEYMSAVAGKKFCNDSGCWTAKKNGRMTGKFGDKRLKAKWKWSKGFGCRAGKLGKRSTGTDCQMFEVSGNKVRVTRAQGKGKRVIYTSK